MSTPQPTEPDRAEAPSVVFLPGEEPTAPDGAATDGEQSGETIEQPAKVMRIGSMIKQLLEEVRAAPRA